MSNIKVDKIKDLVNKLVTKYDTRDPFELVIILGGITVVTHLVGVRGFYQYYKRNNIIYISEDLSDQEKRIVCAHELGHMLLHKGLNALYLDKYTISARKYEVEANMFVSELLIPDDILIDNLHLTTNEFSKLLGLEIHLVDLKLVNNHDLGGVL